MVQAWALTALTRVASLLVLHRHSPATKAALWANSAQGLASPGSAHKSLAKSSNQAIYPSMIYMVVDQNSCILKWTSSPKKITFATFRQLSLFLSRNLCCSFPQCRFNKLQGKMWSNWDVEHKNVIKLGCQAQECDQTGMSSTRLWSNRKVKHKDVIKPGCQ